MTKNVIQLIDVHKKFDHKEVLKGINLAIPEGKMTVVIGRSGEGKSVLLKHMIGLIKPTSGKVLIDGVDITQLEQHELDPYYKKFGYVFQFAALLDSLTVYENIGISLIEKDVAPSEVLKTVKEKLALVNLEEDTLYRYPAQLSGGMRKRVGLARTLVTNPKIILYDEPTTGLDPITSRVIHELMYNMQRRLQITSVIVSHDVEIFKYADYVALLQDGQIQFFGDAATIWQSENPYIYQFIRGLAEGPIQIDVAHEKS